MNDYLGYLADSAHWALSDPDGFPHRILEHLQYTAIALVLGAMIAFPLGLLIGHTRRGAFLVVTLGNLGRSLPTFGVVLLVVAVVGIGLTAPLVALVILAVPPILTATYAGVAGVLPATVDAARAVGMTPLQVATRVELPMALPIVLGGVRNAALQVISTATVVAYVGEGGLGRFLFDGMGRQEYDRVVGGSIVLAVLAIAVDLALGALQRLIVSPGVDPAPLPRRRPTTLRTTPATVAPATDLEKGTTR